MPSLSAAGYRVSAVASAAEALKLRDAGVTQFNIYLDNGNEAQIIETYGDKIIPAFR